MYSESTSTCSHEVDGSNCGSKASKKFSSTTRQNNDFRCIVEERSLPSITAFLSNARIDVFITSFDIQVAACHHSFFWLQLILTFNVLWPQPLTIKYGPVFCWITVSTTLTPCVFFFMLSSNRAEEGKTAHRKLNFLLINYNCLVNLHF